MRNARILVPVLAALCVLAASAGSEVQAAGTTYLKITGGVQGEIRGEVQVPAWVDRNAVYELHHLVHVPYSMGLPSGPTTHEPFVFTKSVNRASPGLYRALDTNESVTAVFDFVKPGPGGTELNYYRVTLSNARVSAVELVSPNILDAANSAFPHMERVRIVYETMQVENLEHNTEYTMSAGGSPGE